MKGLLRRWPGGRLGSLFLKELRQIGRDKRLRISLVVPPALQLILFGLALDADVQNLRLGLVDDSRTAESRELVSAVTENRSFRIAGTYATADDLGDALSRGKLDLGLVIPRDYARERARGRAVDVQLLLNAVNANTAQIAEGYAEAAIAALNERLARQGTRAVTTPLARARVVTRTALLYNPGLISSWFVVTGTFGILLVLNGSLVASAALIKEKESGTVEQLLMTPADAVEIVVAKIAPLFLLLSGTSVLAVLIARLVFDVPIRGNLVLVLAGAALCTLAGIGFGTLIATLARSATQAQLLSFFINPPLAMLSGGTTPIEAMPDWMQPLTLLNPIRHFVQIARGVLIKGADLSVVYPSFLALAAFSLVLVGVSAWRFRRQFS